MKEIFTSLLLFVAIVSNGQNLLDQTFGKQGKFMVYANRTASLIDDNGNIIVAGVHTSLGLVLTKYKSSGIIDSTFGVDGVVRNSTVGDNFINLTISEQNDKYVIGCSKGIIRYSKNGTIDISFGSNGYIEKITPHFITIQADLKLLVSDGKVIKRFTSDGKIDLTFNGTGEFKTDNCTSVGRIALDSNEHIYVIGAINGNQTQYDMVIYSLNIDGTINYDFGNNGFVRKDFGGGNDGTSSIIVEGSNIFVAGYNEYYYSGNLERCDYIVLKLNLSGLLSESFGDVGILRIPFTNTNYTNMPTNLTKHINGFYYIGGLSSDFDSGTKDYGYIARFDSVGHLDHTFNNIGYFKAENMCFSIHILENGSILSTGDPGMGGWNTICKYKPFASLSFDSVYTKTYGDAPFKLYAKSDNSDIKYTSSNASILSIINDTATILGAGEIRITAETINNINFNSTSKVIDVSINKAIIEASPVDTLRKYGIPNPSIRLTYNGFIKQDSESYLDSKPNVIINADKYSPVGLYKISLDGGNDNNYDFKLNDAKLKIEKTDLECRAKGFEKYVGQVNSEFEIIYTGFKNSETEDVLIEKPVATSTVLRESVAGDYPIFLAGGISDNYNLMLINGTIIVKEIPLVNDDEVLSTLQISPNPAIDNFTISSTNLIVDRIELVSLNGNIIKNIDPDQKTITVRDIPVGIYFIRIYTSDICYMRRLVIEQ